MADIRRTIESFHKEIVQWRAAGIGLRPIAKRLEKLGLSGVNFHKVGRYCRNNSIPYNPPQIPPADKSEATDEGELPSTEEAGQQKLFKEPSPDSEPEPWPGKRTPEQREHPVNTGRSRVRATPEVPPKSPILQTPTPTFSFPPHSLKIGVRKFGLDLSSDKTPESKPSPRPKSSKAKRPVAHPPKKTTLPPESPREKPPAPAVPKPAAQTPSPKPDNVSDLVPKPYPPPPMMRRERWNPPPLPFPRMANPPLWTPDLPILEFGDQDVWNLQDSFEGTFILGAVGSGKTSGSGRMLAHAFLERGFGGLVLTVKEDERELWQRYARQTGREQHLCIVAPQSPWHFNFLDYELRRPDLGAGLIENLVDLFYTAVRCHGQDSMRVQLADFWEDSGKQLVRNVFRVLQHSRERLTLKDARKFIAEAPASVRECDQGEWKERDFGKWLYWATETARGTPQESVMEEARHYWLSEFPRIPDKTRACIVTGFTALAEAFIEPAIHDLFCTDTTLAPEAALEGAIIVLDLPVMRYRTVGNFTQSIWKHVFQKVVQARSDARNAACRPVFLWADEAQYFYSIHDGLFQSTARSARCATVYLTQNLSNFYAVGGGHNARERVDGFLGNLNTKIFHANSDPVSNRWAAEQIGQAMTYRFSSSSSTSPSSNRGIGGMFSPNTSQSAGMQQVMDYQVQPAEFMKLRTGSDTFQGQVDAYFVKSGATFSNGKHFFPTVFQQENLS